MGQEQLFHAGSGSSSSASSSAAQLGPSAGGLPVDGSVVKLRGVRQATLGQGAQPGARQRPVLC
jgi:hypothetical protein